MKKYRGGTKIVEFVKRELTNLDKNQECITQGPVAPDTTYNPHEAEDLVPTFQLFISDEQDINVQGEIIETLQHDVAHNVTIYQTSSSIVPTISEQTTQPNYVSQDMFANYLHPATPMACILKDDLYLTDSSDSLADDIRCSINDDNEPSFYKRTIMEADTTYIPNAESTTTEQRNVKRKRRQAVPSQWKKNIRKNKRQHGEPYVSAKGVLVPGRTLKESKCMGLCIHQCTYKFSDEERLQIFSSFWSIGDVEQKRLYIVNLIEREKTNTLRRKQFRKKYRNKYFLKKLGATVKIRVCQKFFIATLSVSESFVWFCFKKVIDNNTVIGDKRGKHAPHNKISNEVREHVRNHIKLFPRISTPHARKYIKKEYLGHNLNLTKMYNLYKIKCDSQQRESVELAYYRSVFNKDFNISFHRSGQYICDQCLTFEQINKEEKEIERQMYKVHLKRVTAVRKHRNQAKKLAQDGEIHFAEFDLKAICDFLSPTSKLKRSLPVYNFTVLDFHKKNHNVHCFYWQEGIARKGAAEIGSCLYKYLQKNADGKPITFMSGTCASQCRNMYISSLLLYCVQVLNIPEINQKYYEKGHRQMETDDIHANIEKAKMNVAIVYPTGFYEIIKKCVNKYPNSIYEMNAEDFIDLKYLKNILVKNTKIDCRGEPVNWLNIRWLQYRKETPNHIYFKYDLSDTEFKKIQVIRRRKNLPNCGEIDLLKKARTLNL